MNFDTNKILKSWLSQLQQFQFQDYEKLPDIDLYMDQVVTYLDRLFKVFEESSFEKQITSSMINNYVKGQVVTAPISKKYNKSHLALLQEVIALKQVLSISEIKQVLDCKYEQKDNATVFNHFKENFSIALKEVATSTSNQLDSINTNDVEALTEVAQNLAIWANAYTQISKRILYLLDHLKSDEKEEIKEESAE